MEPLGDPGDEMGVSVENQNETEAVLGIDCLCHETSV